MESPAVVAFGTLEMIGGSTGVVFAPDGIAGMPST
jgi:hypothetical protein